MEYDTHCQRDRKRGKEEEYYHENHKEKAKLITSQNHKQDTRARLKNLCL